MDYTYIIYVCSLREAIVQCPDRGKVPIYTIINLGRDYLKNNISLNKT